MSLLHRHIFLGVLWACAAAVGLFGFVLIVGNALKDLLGFVLSGQIALDTFLQLLALLVPYVAAYALPMGILTGVLLVLGRMSAQQEVTAMRAAGLSLGYIATPVLVLGLLGAATAAAVNFYYMPLARTAYKETLAGAVQRNPLSFIVPKTFIRDFPGIVLYVGDKQGLTLQDVWLWELDSQKRVVRSGRALSGSVDYNQAEGRLLLTLERLTIDARRGDNPEDFSRPIQTGVIGEFPIELRLDNVLGRQSLRKKLSWMTGGELWAERERLERAAADPGAADDTLLNLTRVRFAISEKSTSALAVLAFALIAVPLGIKVSRKETSANLGVALLLVMSYYSLTVCIGWLDSEPALRPDLLLWIPPLLFLGVGLWLFGRLGRV